MYTREAHPGENLPAHATLADKLAAARRLRDDVGIRREILVDPIDGPVHTDYGLLPNMTWVIGRGGQILYKAMWTSADSVAAFCERLGRAQTPGLSPFWVEQIDLRRQDREAFMERLAINGPRAVQEWNRAAEIMTERAREAAKRRRGD